MTLEDAKPIAIFLMGPTASGKTGLAMKIADNMDVGLISVDSGQIYRGMDIGTAKPAKEELRRYPHALIDIRDPWEVYSADEFREDALAQMELIHQGGKIPLLVGGTMFYFRALQHGLPALPSADAQVREELLREAEQKGWDVLYQRLQQVDPESARRINANDRQRIQRALEIYQLSGMTPTEHAAAGKQDEIPWCVIKIGIWPGERSVLHSRIEQRLEVMFSRGFVEEVEKLRQLKLDSKLPAMRAIGYRQVLEYLDGDTDYEEMRKRCLFSTRQLAKRQLTWLRNDPEVTWFDTEMPDYSEKVLEFLQKKTTV
jgi:tRNA dimethylallyltransferase